MNNFTPYLKLGQFIADSRKKTNINQADFAAKAQVSQQTISRWESGKGRPQPHQLPELATLLAVPVRELMAKAGYTPKSKVLATTRLLEPFPLGLLSEEVFEEFCFNLLDKLYRSQGCKVHRAGTKGDKQFGRDIQVIHPDGKKTDFQCKRYQTFGPAEVKKVVEAHTTPADSKVLLLSRPASPLAREAISAYPGWDIWDRDQITLLVRDLSPATQRQLVDMFFNGHRMVLIGERETGPWQSPEEFFTAFMVPGNIFNHTWSLVGREDELAKLTKHLTEDNVSVVHLIAAAGVGKSKLLKTAVEQLLADGATFTAEVHFLSRTESVSAKSLYDLGAGEKLLIVDDAHDRQDLQQLLEYTASPSSNAKLLLAYRPYGESFITAAAGHVSLVGDKARSIKIKPLVMADSIKLAQQVLDAEAFKGSDKAAEHIAQHTRDCPLATVIGAQVVAREKLPLSHLLNEAAFRDTLMARFQDVLAGQVGAAGEEQLVKRVLSVLSLVQPFHPDSSLLSEIISKVEGIGPDVSSRIISHLTAAGVLFKRGRTSRLSPDMLADYILEKSCIDQQGKTTGYAEKVFQSASHDELVNAVVNIGRLDWRRHQDDASFQTELLDGIWHALKPTDTHNDPHLKAVRQVAFYQPNRALKFTLDLIRKRQFVDQLPAILKNISYNLEFVTQACEALWHLASTETRETNPHPDHPIRILTELCTVELDKPIEYISKAVSYGLSLIDDEKAWSGKFTPWSFLSGALATEGTWTEARGRDFAFNRFSVNPAFILPIRTQVVDAMIAALSHRNKLTALSAAQHLSKALHYPMSGASEEWTANFAQTLSKILAAIQAHKLHPVVQYALIHDVVWLAKHSEEPAKTAANAIIDTQPDDVAYRLTHHLIDGWGSTQRRLSSDFDSAEKELADLRSRLLDDLDILYPDPSQLHQQLTEAVRELNSFGPSLSTHWLPLTNAVFARHIEVALIVVKDLINGKASPLANSASGALAYIFEKDPVTARELVSQLLRSNQRDQLSAAALGYTFAKIDLTPDDWNNLRVLLRHPDPSVVFDALRALRRQVESNHSQVAEEISRANVGLSAHLLDEALAIFEFNNRDVNQTMTEQQIQRLLDRVKTLPELDGYWIDSFLARLSELHPMRTAEFFVARAELATSTDDWKIRPINHGPYLKHPLRFRQSKQFLSVMKLIVTWVAKNAEGSLLAKHRSAELFSSMFAPYDAEFIDQLERWMDTASEAELSLIARILHEAPAGFIFREQPFISRFLERCRNASEQCYEHAMGSLEGSAISGVQISAPGEPSAGDVEKHAQANEILKSLSQFDAAYPLYEHMRDHMKRRMNRAVQDGEEYDD